MSVHRVLLAAGLLVAATGAHPAIAAADDGRVAADTVSASELRYELNGLEQPAEIIVDAWGVPHIYANTHYDAFFVQGFNAARERLWQIDTWRRRGLGRLSEVFGPGYLAQDRAARLFLYRGDMYREWLAYGADAKRIAEAFTAGINAYARLTEQQPTLLPPEFELLNYRPSLWAAEDVVRIRGHGLWRNVTSEVQRARIACRHGLDVAQLWKVLEPAWSPRIPDGLDPCSIPDRVLDDYLLARAPVTFDAQRLQADGRSDGGRDALIADVRRQDLSRDLGSNNWVVAPERTTTGRPILANDPHRTHAVPGLRYIAHLVAPGLDVIGAGEPSLPGISIGHNGRIAFGLTIFPIDQEDLYVYERVGDGYRYQGRVEPLTTVVETIPVLNGEPRNIELKFTRHGPVVHSSGDRLFAVRAGWLEPGMAPYFGSVEYMRAQNWREFVGALNRWGAPGENQVYADVEGNIGYKAAGLFPRRRSWDGLLPVPGSGRFEWEGFFDMDALPVEVNPPLGFSATANALTLPADYPIGERRVGFEWSAPWRQKRVFEVLGAQNPHSPDQSLALQRDYHSVLARTVLEALPAQAAGTAGEALALLQDWDHVLAPDSAPALLYAVWFYGHLTPALAAALLPEAPEDLLPLDTLTVIDTLRYPVGQTVALESLASALTAVRERFGDESGSWRWGDLHQVHFEHPLLGIADAELAQLLRLPAHPRGGSANTANNTSFQTSDYRVRSGASFRMVLDVGNWDAARMTNAPGQSGDPRSPFYDNLLHGWATDGSFPLWYSREAVEAHRVVTIHLTPAPGQSQ
jgi:penicillin G amidase